MLLKKVLLFTFFTVAAAGVVSAAEIEREKWKFVPIAAPFYTPDTSWGGGAFLLAYRNVITADDNETDQIGLFSTFTLKDQKSFGVTPDIVLTDSLRFMGKLAYQDNSSEFWGTGPDSGESDLEDYTIEEFFAEAALLRKFSPYLYFGPMVRFRHSAITGAEEDGIIDRKEVAGSSGGSETGAGARLIFDTTDSPFYPLGGTVADMTLLYTGFSSASDYEYLGFTGDFRHFIQLTGKHVLALQGVLELRTEDVPLQSMSTLGGSMIMRGYSDSRFTDINSLSLQAEYRFPLISFLAGAVFASAGTVGSDFPDLFIAEAYHYAAGGGLRFLLDRDQHIAIRIDFGYSEEGLNTYFLFREAF